MSLHIRRIEWLRGVFAKVAAPTPEYTVYLPGETLSPVTGQMVQVLHPQGGGMWMVADPDGLTRATGVAFRVDPNMPRAVQSDDGYGPFGTMVRGRTVINDTWR